MSSSHRKVTASLIGLVSLFPIIASAQDRTNTASAVLTSISHILSTVQDELTYLMSKHAGSAQLAAVGSLGTGVGSCGTLASNTSLSSGQSIVSCNGTYTLIFQGDGNVVIYPTSSIGNPSQSRWSTQTAGQSATQLAMQGDGNLVLYNGSTALWGSRSQPGGTYGRAGHLVMGDNGVVSVFANDDGAILWSSSVGVAATQSTPSNTVQLTGTFNGLLAGAASPALSGTASRVGSNETIYVDVYTDGPATSADNYSHFTVRVPANISGHTFQWTIPTQYQGSSHTFYLYMVTADGYNGTPMSNSPQTIAVPKLIPPTVSISADNSSISVGQSTTIRAHFAPGSGDTLIGTDIDENGPDTNNVGVNKAYSGSQWGTAVQQSLSYTFTPTKPGAYGFYTFVQTNNYPSWTAVPSNSVSVNVTPAQAPGIPLMMIDATTRNVTVGKSVYIVAKFTPGYGDEITSTDIDEVRPDGSQFNARASGEYVGTTLESPMVYLFEATTPGTYVFKPYVSSRLHQGWNPSDSSKWITITVTPEPANPLDGKKIRLGPPVITHGPSSDIIDVMPGFVQAASGGFYTYGANQVGWGKSISSLTDWTGDGKTGPNSQTILDKTTDPIHSVTTRSNYTVSWPGGQINPIAPALNSDACGGWPTAFLKQNGMYYAYVHNEGPCDYVNDFAHGGFTNESSSMWSSTTGAPGTWTPLKVAGLSPGTIISSNEQPEAKWLTGFGDCTMIPDDTGPTWVYAYCSFFTDSSTSDYHNAIARAPINALGPGNWKFLYRNSFSSPALDNPYDPSTKLPQADLFEWYGSSVATIPGTSVKALAVDAKNHTYWHPTHEGMPGLALSASSDYKTFTTLHSPLINYDFQNFMGRPTPDDLYLYSILRNDTDGSSVLKPDHFSLWTIYVPPNNDLSNRYVEEYPVTLTKMTTQEISSNLPQVALTLETWYNTQTGKYRTTTINPFASATNGQTESNWEKHDTPGYIMTSCPGSATINQCDDAGAKIANRIEECWKPSSNSNTPWNDDYQLNIDTNGTTGSCPSGWKHVRTAGWLYKAPQQFATHPVYACYISETDSHAASIDPACNGHKPLGLLGYAPIN